MSIFNTEMKNHDNIVLVEKNKLITINILISKALINSYIHHEEFVPVNNVQGKNDKKLNILRRLWSIL